MDYKLSGKETAGVIAVGLVTSEIARRAANAMKSNKSHQIAMVVGGATLYYAGVVVGTNRPAAGYIGSGNTHKSGSCGSCGSHNVRNGSCSACGSHNH